MRRIIVHWIEKKYEKKEEEELNEWFWYLAFMYRWLHEWKDVVWCCTAKQGKY